MPEQRHPIDDLLRDLAGLPEPTDADLAHIHARLDAAIASDRSIRRRVGLVWSVGIAGVVAGLALVVVAGKASPAEAAITEIAALAQSADRLEATDTEFVYTRSTDEHLSTVPAEMLGDAGFDRDFLHYLLTSTRQTWFGNEGTEQIHITYEGARFFTEEDEAAYYAAGLDEVDHLGETVTSTVLDAELESWPAEERLLDEAIRAAMRTDRGLPEAVEYLDVAIDIVRESFSSPELRAATLRLIATLDGLEVQERAPDGTVTFSIGYDDNGNPTNREFAIDRNGYLRAEQVTLPVGAHRFGIPAGTTTYAAEHLVPAVTESLGAPAP